MKSNKPPNPKTPTSAAQTAADSNDSKTAEVHDMVGAAFLILPKELRALISDRALQAEADTLQAKEVLVIVRAPGVVVYAHLPIVAMELAGNVLDLAKGRTSFRAITDGWAERLNEQVVTQQSVAVIEPTAAGGRDA